MTYPPVYRSLVTLLVGVFFGCSALAGIAVGANWAQRIACLMVAVISFALAFLEWQKPTRRSSRYHAAHRAE